MGPRCAGILAAAATSHSLQCGNISVTYVLPDPNTNASATCVREYLQGISTTWRRALDYRNIQFGRSNATVIYIAMC